MGRYHDGLFARKVDGFLAGNSTLCEADNQVYKYGDEGSCEILGCVCMCVCVCVCVCVLRFCHGTPGSS